MVLNEIDKICSPVIRVIGIGGAGLNATNAMITGDVNGVQYMAVASTEAQLKKSLASAKLRISDGQQRFGTGGNPKIACQAAEAAHLAIVEQLSGTDLVFLVAGMGGGTGTGATPVIARLAKDSGCLTVAIVTRPFIREGSRRMKQAEQGIQSLAAVVDCLIVIPNDRLISLSNKEMTMLDAFKPADELLKQAVVGIVEIVEQHGHINADFNDIRTVMAMQGMGLIGVGIARGEKRAEEAATKAIANPLLEDSNIEEARGLLLNISGSSAMTIEEFDRICAIVTGNVADDATVIIGMVVNEDLQDQIKVTVIVTGLHAPKPVPTCKKPPIVVPLRPGIIASLDTPTYLRKRPMPQRPVWMDESDHPEDL